MSFDVRDLDNDLLHVLWAAVGSFVEGLEIELTPQEWEKAEELLSSLGSEVDRRLEED